MTNAEIHEYAKKMTSNVISDYKKKRLNPKGLKLVPYIESLIDSKIKDTDKYSIMHYFVHYLTYEYFDFDIDSDIFNIVPYKI